jgi:hypothetical protein
MGIPVGPSENCGLCENRQELGKFIYEGSVIKFLLFDCLFMAKGSKMTDILDINRKVMLIKDSKSNIINMKLYSMWEKL